MPKRVHPAAPCTLAPSIKVNLPTKGSCLQHTRVSQIEAYQGVHCMCGHVHVSPSQASHCSPSIALVQSTTLHHQPSAAHAQMRAKDGTAKCTQTHTHTHSSGHVSTSRAYVRAHTQVHMHAHMQAHRRTGTLTHTRARIQHTRIHTHTYTHARARIAALAVAGAWDRSRRSFHLGRLWWRPLSSESSLLPCPNSMSKLQTVCPSCKQ